METVLWHIPFSHYNEKVRWALDLKGVEHQRRTAGGGAHMLVSLWKTKGKHKTFPLVVLDGKPIADSTAIIAALERQFPEPPLYPRDPVACKRALELEDFFDEQLGPHMRRLMFHEVIRDRAALETFVPRVAPSRMRWAYNRLGVAAFMHMRFGTHSVSAAEDCRRKVVAALDRLEAELGGGEYLVDDRFTVADLTAASLFYPLVLPPEGPDIGFRIPEALLGFRDGLGRRRGLDWVKEMFRRHRLTDRAPVTAAAAALEVV